MLIRYFRRVQPSSPVLLFLIGAILWAEVFIYPDPTFFTPVTNPAPFYSLLQPLFMLHPLSMWVVAYLFLYIQSLMINQVLTSQGILDKYSFFTSLLYMILMSADGSLQFFHPALIANFFLLIALRKIFKTYDEGEVMLEVFNVGLFIAIAGLFHPQSWMFFLLLVISLFLYYVISLRSLLAAIIGFATPFLFYFVVLFLWDRFDEHLFVLPFYFSWFGSSTGIMSNITTALIAVVAGLTLLAFFHLLLLHLPDKPIRLRKRLWTIVYFFLVALISFLFVPDFQPYYTAILFIPVAAMLAGFFHQIDRKVIAEVLFTILLGLVIAGKIHNLFVI